MTVGNTSTRAILVGLTIAAVGLLAAGAVSGAATDQTAPAEDESAFVVDLQSNGSATVAVTYTFDLDESDEQAAFEELRDDQEAREDLRERFENRMGDVAADASTATDREMAVADTTIEIERSGSTGVVTVSLSWSELAAVNEDQLTVTEPFASGFEPERTFVVQLPDGYSVVAEEPQSDRQDENRLVWDSGTDLSGFELTASAEESELEDADSEQTDDEQDDAAADDGAADDDGPGFGLAVAVAGVIALAAFALRKTKNSSF